MVINTPAKNLILKVRGMVMKIRVEIPDRSITRSKLEYPTEDVNFAYLASIERIRVFRDIRWTPNWNILTSDIFSDRAVEAYTMINNCDSVFGRHNLGNRYFTQMWVDGATQDHVLKRFIAGAATGLGYEAVDLIAGRPEQFVHSIFGSSLKSFRAGATTPQVTATDTALASGHFGFASVHDRAVQTIGLAWLRPARSPAPPASAVLEVEVEGSGAPEDPYKPSLPQNLAEIPQLTGLPSFLYQEAKKYEILKNKGFTDEEMRLLLGYIPQHQVDLGAVTWGAFEFKEDSPTNIIVITEDNPYQSGAVERQAEQARSKNLKVLRPPRDYGEAVAQYQRLKRDYPNWLAGKDNYAYQVLGLEELDLLQNVDFYHGELIEHKTHYQQLKQIPDFEMWRRLEVLEEKLSKITVLTEERDKHISKVKEVKRLGW